MTADRSTTTRDVLARLDGGLVVSCQSDFASTLGVAAGDAAMAVSAASGGAVAIRTHGVESVAAIRQVVELPVIGIQKVAGPRRRIITPSDDQVFALARAGATIVAVEFTQETATDRPDRIRALRDAGLIVMADVSTYDEGIAAWTAGADIVATTLSGYTPYSSTVLGPDLDLVVLLAGEGVRVIAEGRYSEPRHVDGAFAAGAFAVVAGQAITDPTQLTRRLVAATPRDRTSVREER